MTPEEFAERMRAAARSKGDAEDHHMLADELMVELLRSLGYGEGCDIFEEMPRWYA